MPWPSPDHIMEHGYLPTPFSAAQIREACPAGRTVRFLVEKVGSPTLTQVTTFLAADELGAEHQTVALLDDEPLGDPIVRSTGWEGFQAHASFPAQATELGEETIEIPAGRFECWRYTVTGGDESNTFWFAQSLPGMPVKVEIRRNDTVISTMTMLAPGA